MNAENQNIEWKSSWYLGKNSISNRSMILQMSRFNTTEKHKR